MAIYNGGLSIKNISETEILNLVYPVGSIYLAITDTAPPSIIGGTWERLPEGYALWTASRGAGKTISAGLPNIIGSFAGGDGIFFDHTESGAFSPLSSTKPSLMNSQTGRTYCNGYSFDASKGTVNTDGTYQTQKNSPYGKNNTVQPPAYKVYAWKRTA